MKKILTRIVLVVLFAAVAGCAASVAQTDRRGPMPPPGNQIDLSYFYESLSPYGEWFQDPSYGWCWTPYDVSADWRPYSDGHWEYTDYGWSWASNETWGWATYHYGRWFFDDSYGWSWVPGTEWAPAWVAWRYGDDYVGWAPLPPDAGWDGPSGLRFTGYDAIPPARWCFVPRRHVFDTGLQLQVTLIARNVTLFGRSRDATRYEVRDGRPANLGLDIGEIERSIGRSVPRVRIVDVPDPSRGGGRPAGSGVVGFFRPTVRPMPVQQPPPVRVTDRPGAVPDVDFERVRGEQQRRLETELKTEQTRLVRMQQGESQAQAQGAAAEAVQRQHAAEQQAFDAHAAQQRQVLEQRLLKRIVNLGKAGNPGKAAAKPNDQPGKQGKGQDKQGKGQDKQDKGQDKQDKGQDKGNK
jgi:hypothetical protein